MYCFQEPFGPRLSDGHVSQVVFEIARVEVPLDCPVSFSRWSSDGRLVRNVPCWQSSSSDLVMMGFFGSAGCDGGDPCYALLVVIERSSWYGSVNVYRRRRGFKVPLELRPSD